LLVTFQCNVDVIALQSLPYEVGILRQFTFTSKLQRMSVVTRQLGNTGFDLFAKGSPEMITSLCDASTGNAADKVVTRMSK
jgi:magnesium-transporting ATPase (P-type)